MRLAQLADLRRRQVAFRQLASQIESTQTVGVATVGLGLVPGQNPRRRRVGQMRIELQFLEQIRYRWPAERRFQGHRRALGQPRQPPPHPLLVLMVQPRSLDHLKLPLLVDFHYTDLAELPMRVPSHPNARLLIATSPVKWT